MTSRDPFLPLRSLPPLPRLEPITETVREIRPLPVLRIPGRRPLSQCVLLVERDGEDVTLDVTGYVREDTVDDVLATSCETGRTVELTEAEHDRACRKLAESAS